MQKLKEWIEKDKDPEEILPDLVKSYSKALPRLLEILYEFLDYNPSWNFDPANSVKCKKAIVTLNTYLKKLLFLIPSGSYSLDLTQIETQATAIFNHKWSAAHALIPGEYEVLKKLILATFCNFLKHFLKLLGTASIHPKVLKIVRNTMGNCGYETFTNSMLKSFLVALGSCATDIVAEYLQRFGVSEKTIQQLGIMTYEETVTLGLCKKDKKKKIGNAHQRRNHKIVMKKTENRKLKAMVEDMSERPGVELIQSNIELISQYLISSPTGKLDLEGLFTLQLHKLSTEMQFSIVQLMFYYSVTSKTHAKKLKTILQSQIKNVNYRNTCRHYLFLLENLNK